MKHPILWSAALLLGMTHPARADECGPRAAVLQALYEKYKESPAFLATNTDGTRLVEITVSPNGETWTLLVIRPDGLTCLLATGKDWRPLSETGEPL